MNIGRYEVVKELGRGGMAIVYLARDPYIKRQVAVKVLPRQFTFDPQFRARFQREAEMIATLEHDAIVPVYDFGEHEEQPFIVMRYMSGGSLADRLEGGALPIPEITALLQRVGAAIDYAHSRGVIHRDLKPGNILFDSHGAASLSDFGIAKLAESTSAFTGTGIIGTPEYMAPEQAQGEKDIDGRCDIYSLGVVLFQALTGDLPYKADTPLGVAMAHVMQPVPALTERRPDLPRTYDTVVRKALDKDRSKRYQTAGQMATALKETSMGSTEQTMLEHKRTVLEPPSDTYVELPTPVPPPRFDSLNAPASPPPASNKPITPPPSFTPTPLQKKSALPRWLGFGGIGLLALCVCIGIIGGFASGLIPNFFAPAAPVASTNTLPVGLPSETAVVVNESILTAPESPAVVTEASPTALAEPNTEIASGGTVEATSQYDSTLLITPTQSGASLTPSFTANEAMLCREGPSTTYADHWDLKPGETVPVLAAWYQDFHWLLVDIDAPATETRTDCCWVGGDGTLNVSVNQIRTIDFLPDRLDCSALK